MGKIYKGYELIEKASEDEIEDYTKFKMVGYLDKIIVYRQNSFWRDDNEKELVTSWLINEEWQIIEEEPEIDIQSFKELLLDQLREREHTNADIYLLGTQINALIKAVKQLDLELKTREKKDNE